MIKLKATKEKMYELAGAYLGPEVPGIQKTDFIEYKNVYYLAFYSDINNHEGINIRLGTVCGSPILLIAKTKYSKDNIKITIEQTEHPSVQDLRNLGMIEETPDLTKV
jgi:hypothetical protein